MRATIRTLHRYLGLLLVLPLIVQGVTGGILALEPILGVAPTIPSTAAVDAVSVDAIVAAARGVAPEGMRPTRYVPPASSVPAEVWFAPSSGPPQRGIMIVRVDPVTMTPIWPPDLRDGPTDWMRRLHTNFLLPDLGGRSLVGWVGVGLLLLSIMGIPLWWPAAEQWRAAVTFSVTERGVRFHRRLHGAIGIWTVMFLIVSGATGAVLGFPLTVRGALGIPTGGQGARETSRPAGNPTMDKLGLGKLDRGKHDPEKLEPGKSDPGATDVAAPTRKLDAAMTLARAGAPGTVPRMIFLPAGAGGPIRVSLAKPSTEGAAAMTTVTIDPSATRVIAVQDPGTMSGAELSLRWVHDIHFGQGLGPIWRALTVATGLALPVFAITGTAMWWHRNRARRRVAFERRGFSPGE